MKTESYLDYVDQLNPSYREVFDQVVRYTNLLDGMNIIRKNEKVEDLLEIMLSAQQAGRPVEKVCGRNVQSFCREFFGEYDIRFDLYEVLNASRIMIWMMVIEALIFVIEWFRNPGTSQSGNLFWQPVDDFCAEYILVVTVASLFLTVSNIIERHIMFERKKFSKTLMNCFHGFLVFLYIVAALIFFVNERVDMISLPLGIQLTGGCLWLAVLYYLKGALKADAKEYVYAATTLNTLMAGFSKDIGEKFPIAMEEKYRTVREKKQKKGITYQMSDFLTDEKKESVKMLKLWYLFVGLPIISLVPIIMSDSELLNIEFADNGSLETFSGSLIIYAVECIVMFILWRLVKKTALTRLAWIRQKREQMVSGES